MTAEAARVCEVMIMLSDESTSGSRLTCSASTCQLKASRW